MQLDERVLKGEIIKNIRYINPDTGEHLSDISSFVQNNKINLLPLNSPFRSEIASKNVDVIHFLKEIAKKKFKGIYSFFIILVAPVCPRVNFSTRELYISFLVKKYIKKNGINLQIGAGNFPINTDLINIDIMPYDCVDIIADGTKLPFSDSSVDLIVSSAVIEHVENYSDFIKEFYRILKPGGIILTGAPFLQGYHASPYDFTRWTKTGLISLHEKFHFSTVNCTPGAGPTSALCWILHEWLATVLSFGSKRLFSLFWMLLLGPISLMKWPDLFLVYYPSAENIASFFYYVGRKDTSN